jgi:hypothetical protein
MPLGNRASIALTFTVGLWSWEVPEGSRIQARSWGQNCYRTQLLDDGDCQGVLGAGSPTMRTATNYGARYKIVCKHDLDLTVFIPERNFNDLCDIKTAVER